MNTLSIFAGLDANGQIRFVGDVARGAECGCCCVACGAPLVARRGDVRAWHFAHEASQERPDCFTGAVNLLRRLAVERLKAQGLPPMPAYRASVTARPPLPPLHEMLEWHPGDGVVEHWESRLLQSAFVALLRLHSGTGVRVFVEISGASNASLVPATSDEGVLLLTLPLPSSSEDLKDLGAAVRHIDVNIQSRWIRLPDANAKIIEVRERLEDRARTVRDEAEALRRRGSLPTPGLRAASPPPYPSSVPASSPSAPPLTELDDSPWSAWRKPRSAFMCYGLADGTAWILFTHHDGRRVMAAWPLNEGWDESMPARIGVPDLNLGVYVLEDQLKAMIYLGEMRPRVRSASNWSELLAIEWLHRP
ncbi:hypothetical protein M2282_004618 [Variovorax boronicumulans]|uniref:competence protein CoiA family protein n=1 Tax=Variovorax boronicumulans TaxID=436515 RepID=UPI002473CF78|nr:hypothetical protein [Variovorax boronicumulans]MDH6169450.1 hypothetical protein [Variovorax boronicumulans]